VDIVKVVQSDPHLFEMVGALQSPGCFSGRLHRGKEQRDQDPNDRDYDQQFNQREPRPPSERTHRQSQSVTTSRGGFAPNNVKLSHPNIPLGQIPLFESLGHPLCGNLPTHCVLSHDSRSASIRLGRACSKPGIGPPEGEEPDRRQCLPLIRFEHKVLAGVLGGIG